MTPGEAARLMAIVKTADGGCGHCIDSLTARLVREYPDHDWWTLRHTIAADPDLTSEDWEELDEPVGVES